MEIVERKFINFFRKNLLGVKRNYLKSNNNFFCLNYYNENLLENLVFEFEVPLNKKNWFQYIENKKVYSYLSTLNEPERNVLYYLFVEKLTLSEVAVKKKKSKQLIYYYRKKFLKIIY